MAHLAAHSRRLNSGNWVLFLTPCHAAPWHSHTHAALPMRFLDCSPPGWGPAVECLNPGLGFEDGLGGGGTSSEAVDPSSRIGSESSGGRGSGGSSTAGSGGSEQQVQAQTLQPMPAALRDCRRRFNASAAIDAAFASERQRYEAAPAAFLQVHFPGVASGSATGNAVGGSGSGSSAGQAGDSNLSSGFGCSLPKQVVLFDKMLDSIAAWAQPRGYVRTKRFAHAQFGVDGEREAAVLLLERQ